jgi:hypothetical protein
MKKLILLVFSINLACSNGNNLDLALFQGSYVNTKYLKLLTTFHSPRIAADSAVFVTYKLKSTDAKFDLPEEENFYILSRAKEYPGKFAYYSLFSFHESDISTIIKLEASENGFYELTTTDQKYSTNHKLIKFIISGKDTLSIQKTIHKDGRIQVDTLLKESTDVSNMVNRLVIAGQYRYGDHAVISFAEDGTGKWNESKFEYRLGLDPFYSDYDVLEVHSDSDIPLRNQIKCFQVVDDKLYLYDAKTGEVRIERTNEIPTMVLKKTNY